MSVASMTDGKLPALLDERKDEILDRWARAIRQRSIAKPISEERLRDALPFLLERIARLVGRGPGELEAAVDSFSHEHAGERLEIGDAVDELVADYVVLRHVVIDVAHEVGGVGAEELACIDRAIDRAIVETTRRFVRASHARLSSTAAFGEQLLGIVSHDLRTPLNAITLGTASLLRTEGMPPRAQRTTERVQRAADNMAKMIDQLLDFTRTRLGSGIPITPQPMRLDDLCRELVEQFQMAYPESAFTLTRRGDASGRWDADRLRQAVSNLVENALIHGTSGRVTIAVEDMNDVVELSVHNTGEPIAAERIETMFEPFRQAGPNRRGLGLGLFVAAEVVRAHGGTISARSTADEGTTLVVRLPRDRRGAPT